MSKLWVVKDIPESGERCWEYETGDTELIVQGHGNKPLIMVVMDEEDYNYQPNSVENFGLEVEIEEVEEFYGRYFATLIGYRYLKNNKLNRKLYECLAENGDYFVGRKV